MLDELRLAARLGFLLLPDPLLASFCAADGPVLRFDPTAPEDGLRRALVKTLAEADLPAGVIHTLTY